MENIQGANGVQSINSEASVTRHDQQVKGKQ